MSLTKHPMKLSSEEILFGACSNKHVSIILRKKGQM